jgi:hypothetical protein
MAANHRALVLGSLCSLLAGCGGIPLLDSSFADRCAAIMQRAMPSAEIEITSKTANGDPTRDLNALVAHVKGTVTGEGGGDIGMDCVFHNRVLTSIRWVDGPER